MSHVVIGTGSDLPERVVTNDDIELASHDYDRTRAGKRLHDWVMERAGVATRHRLAPGEGTTGMAVRAVRRALDDARVGVEEVDLLVLATFTSDARLPSTVSHVARALDIGGKCLQLESGCTGFVDAVMVATALMRAAAYRTVVVVATEAMSAVVDDRAFMYQTIFGDGAGAVVVRDVPGSPYGIEAVRSHTAADVADWTWAPGGGTKHPITAEVLADRSQFISLDHRSIRRFAVEKMVEATHEVLNAGDLTVDDIDWLVPHQTGANIIADVAEQLKIDDDRVVTCLDHTGNVSGASVAVALDEASRDGRLADGDRVVVTVVGSGMAWGALSLRWQRPRAVV